MNTIFIYTLEHPLTGEIRYVGKTKNPKMRFHNHCNKLHNEKTHKRNWINKLRNKGLRPIMKILDEVLEDEWKYWERYWIYQMKAWGFNLVNHTSGGEGSICGNKTSFKKGQVPINKGKGLITKFCKNCANKFESYSSLNKNFCSKKCRYEYISKHPNNGNFRNGFIPWNKEKKGYKLKGKKEERKVLQIDAEDNIIREFSGCNEAANIMNCIPENIRRCCVDESKSAKGYKWKYKN